MEKNDERLYAITPQEIDEFGEQKQAEGFKQGIFVAVTTMVAIKYVPKLNRWYKGKKAIKQQVGDSSLEINNSRIHADGPKIVVTESGTRGRIFDSKDAAGTVAYIKPNKEY